MSDGEGTPKGGRSPRSPKGSPKGSPRGSRGSLKGSPKGSPRGSARGSPRARYSPSPSRSSRGGSPRRTRSPSRSRSPSPSRTGAEGNNTTDAKYASATDPSTPLPARLSLTLSLLQDAHEDLKGSKLRDYDGLEDLQESLRCVRHVGEEVEREYVGLCRDMGALRKVLEDVQGTISGKLTTEGVDTWLTNPPAHRAAKKEVAEEKATLVQASRARAALARAAAEVPRAEERAAKLELQVAKALDDAQVAAEEAEEAAKLAEEAKIAADLKKQKEEEAARKAELARKKKEEEERKRKEEEERRKEEEARAAGSPEELERRKKEAERRDPNNWTPWVYSVDPGDMDVPIGCVIRSIAGGVPDRDTLTVDRLDQLGGPLTLGDNEELVSNIIKIGLSDEETELHFEEPLAVAIPHCAPRVTYREPVIKALQPSSGKWTELSSADVILEDIKEYKFLQARVPAKLLPATLAVVTRVRTETCNVSKKGAKLIPGVDGRICVTFKPAMYKNTTPVMLEVQPVELSVVADVKYRYRDETAALLTSSPMLSLRLPTRRLHKPVTVQLPVPPNPHRKQRPTTATERGEKPGAKARPTSAFMPSYKKDDEDEDVIYLLHINQDGLWGVLSSVELTESKNKDLVVFTMETELINRMLVLRTKNDATVPQVEKIANLLDHGIKHRITQVLCRQKNDDAALCAAQFLPVSKIDRYQKKFEEDGYETGPNLSRELVLREGQEITLRFRGNIRPFDLDPEYKFVYNSHIRTRVDFGVEEIDTFAQKGIDCYRGFAQFFTRGMVQKEVLDSNKKRVVRTEEGDVLLTELLISLPKPPAEAPKPITRAPVVMKNDDVVSNELLRHLAAEIGDEWKKLALHLSIRRVRIQAILRNNVNADAEESIYDMLLTWAKKVPRSTNKVELLTSALMNCGRPDLAEDLKDKENDFRRERALSARDSHLQRAFIKVAQDAHVAGEWRVLCSQLGLSAVELADVEARYGSSRERCYEGLQRWRALKDTASVESLIKRLKRCKYHNVAAQVRHIIS